MNYGFLDDYDVFTQNDYYEVAQRLDDAADWLSEVIDLLYGKKEFNLTDFENALGEAGAYLGVKLPKNELSVEIY